MIDSSLWASVLFSWVVACAVVGAHGQDGGAPPSISIGGWLENDFQSNQWIFNSSPPLGESPFPGSILVPATVRGLSIVCNASYPIEWKFHRERWGGRSRHQYALQSTRFSDGLDVKGFSVEISFFSFESNSVSGNYTCQKVGYAGLSSSLYIFWEGSSPPFLTLAKAYRKPPSIPYRKESKSFTLPCTVSVPSVAPSLSKEVGDKQVPMEINGTIRFDPRVGYTLSNLEDPFGRYTCQVGDAEDDGDGDLISFKVFDGDDGPKPEFNDTTRHGAYYHIDSVKKELVCCSASPKPPKLKLVECTHPTICAVAKHTLHTMESAKKTNGSCATVNFWFLRSGVFRCVGSGIDVVREYFFPMPEVPQIPFRLGGKGGGGGGRKKPNVTTADPNAEHIDPYFDWNEADPLKMMMVTKVSRPVYVGENRTFSCRVNHFYYAQGIVWGVEVVNETIQYFSGREGKSPQVFLPHIGTNRHFQILVGGNQAYIDVTIVPELRNLTCYAPIWNSTEWGKKTIKLNVRVPTHPVLVGEAFTEISWKLNDTNKVLECKFEGEPVPRISWQKGNKTFALNTKTINGTSSATFPVVSLETQNDYECIGTNEAGTVSKRFRVNVIHSGSSSALATTLGISIVGLLVVSIALGVMYKYLKSQKSVISHLTNLAFKDVASSDPATPGNRGLVPTDANGVVLPSPPLPASQLVTHSAPTAAMLDRLNKDNSFLFNSHLEHPDVNPDQQHATTTISSSSSPPLSFPSYQKF